ncbi:hypothetical protein BGW80DRAFT_329898 [Lactifluus volemus]|nr:hypothetical protein BGW80DRAFT_329898 [Lactifluus volemus]
MAPSTIEPGRPNFSAVVHRGDDDVRPDSAQGAPSRSSIATSRPSSSSFKPGTDGGVVRSKRNFKHLGALPSDPPMSPVGGDLGAGELAALLQEAAWLEQRLSDENMTFDISPSTPSFQVHPAASNLSGETPPKSARPRKYFSLRGALRGQRLSMSSEMSSDDSAPVATPPSPNFELSMTQAAHGHGNDTMSIRSMFSIRSNRSGKSDSVPGSLRLSPRRSVSRASSFAERLFNRAMRSKSMLDDPDDAIPEQSPMLPPITSETPSSLLSISPINSARAGVVFVPCAAEGSGTRLQALIYHQGLH